MFTIFIAYFDYEYHTTDQDVGVWLAYIQKWIAAYNLDHDVIERMMQELNINQPTAVQKLHTSIVHMRQQHEAQMSML